MLLLHSAAASTQPTAVPYCLWTLRMGAAITLLCPSCGPLSQDSSTHEVIIHNSSILLEFNKLTAILRRFESGCQYFC